MRRSEFLFYNVTGGIAWVTICMGAGFLFGNVPIIKDNFTLVTIGIVIVSVLPMVFEVIKHRKRN
jgi:membrane-associated protein